MEILSYLSRKETSRRCAAFCKRESLRAAADKLKSKKATIEKQRDTQINTIWSAVEKAMPRPVIATGRVCINDGIAA